MRQAKSAFSICTLDVTKGNGKANLMGKKPQISGDIHLKIEGELIGDKAGNAPTFNLYFLDSVNELG